MILVGHDIESVAAVATKPILRTSRVIFADAERRYCAERPDPFASLAGVICAKEAFIKAVTAVKDRPLFSFTDVEVAHETDGRPTFRLRGELERWCAERALSATLSISHTADLASAVVIVYLPDGH